VRVLQVVRRPILAAAIAFTALALSAVSGAGASASSSGPPTAAATTATQAAITQCFASMNHQAPTTVAQATRCAPKDAQFIQAGAAISAPGAYVTSAGDVILVTSTPVAPAAASPASTSCVYKSYTNWDGGFGYEDLGDEFCWTGYEAWATNPPQTFCYMYPVPPAGNCVSVSKGVINNYSSSYSSPVDPWANFYNDYPPFGLQVVGMRMYMQPNGNWWQYSFGP